MLKGQEIVDRGKYHSFQFESASKDGKKLVYFFVKVTNKRYKEIKRVSFRSFQLETVEGEVSETEQTTDYINGDLSIGRSCRGGVAFDYYNDQTPKTLIFDLGLVEKKEYGYLTLDEERLYAKSPDLRKFFK